MGSLRPVLTCSTTSREEHRILGKWRHDRGFEQRVWPIGIDDRHPIGGKKDRDLILGAERNGVRRRQHLRRQGRKGRTRENKGVRIVDERRGSRVLCQEQVEAIVRRAIREVSGPLQRCRRRVRHGSVSPGELDDHRLGVDPTEGTPAPSSFSTIQHGTGVPLQDFWIPVHAAITMFSLLSLVLTWTELKVRRWPRARDAKRSFSLCAGPSIATAARISSDGLVLRGSSD
jgi:hypothetical protein